MPVNDYLFLTPFKDVCLDTDMVKVRLQMERTAANSTPASSGEMGIRSCPGMVCLLAALM
jgi:hypothetical protein